MLRNSIFYYFCLHYFEGSVVLWVWPIIRNQVGLTRYLLVHLTQPVEWWKIHSLRKLANIDDHRDGTSISKLNDCFFLKCLVLYFCCLLQLGFVRFRDLCIWSLFRFFSVSKVNNGVQNFHIYPNNNSKCAISRDDL